MSMYNDKNLDPFDDGEDAPPEESNNRAFLLIAGGLGLIVLLAMVCLGGYILLGRNSQQQANATLQAQNLVQETVIASLLTQTAQTRVFTQTASVTPTVPPTNTPVIAQPTATPTPQPTNTIPVLQMEIVSGSQQTSVPQYAACQPPRDWGVYIVQRNDTLASLAQRTGVDWHQIQVANCLSGTTIFAGQSLYLPFIIPQPPIAISIPTVATILPASPAVPATATFFDTPNPANTDTAIPTVVLPTFDTSGVVSSTPDVAALPTFSFVNTPITGGNTPVAAFTQTGAPSLQEAFNEVNQQFQDSIKSNIVYTAPQSMQLDETVTVELLLNPSMSQGELATQIINQSDLVTSTAQPGQLVNPQGGNVAVVPAEIQITDLMRAELRSTDPDAFTIQLLNPNMDQPISSSITTKWHWSVTAKKAGTKTLVLVISRLIKKDEKELWVEVQSYEANIVVQVTPTQRIKSWDWKWLTTILIIPIAKFLYDAIKRRKSSQDENAVANEQEIIGSKKTSKPQ